MSACSASRGKRTWSCPSTAKMCPLGRQCRRRAERACKRPSAARPFTQMIEGEKTFDITLRMAGAASCQTRTAILDIPVEVSNNVTSSGQSSVGSTPFTGAAPVFPRPVQVSRCHRLPAACSTARSIISAYAAAADRRPGDTAGTRRQAGPQRRFRAPGASTIYREQGNRLIAVKFGVRGRDLASTVAKPKRRRKSCSTPLIAPSGAANFKKWRRPKSA